MHKRGRSLGRSPCRHGRQEQRALSQLDVAAGLCPVRSDEQVPASIVAHLHWERPVGCGGGFLGHCLSATRQAQELLRVTPRPKATRYRRLEQEK